MDKLPWSCNNLSMSKTFIVELTEKELKALQTATITEQLNIVQGPLLPTEKEKALQLIGKVSDKLILAHFPPEDVLITSADLFFLVDSSIKEYRLLRGDSTLSGKRVEESDFKHISLANAVIMWLNSHRLLKKHVRFDMTDDSFEYEVTEE